MDEDPAFQERMKDPEFAESIHQSTGSLMDEEFSPEAKRAVIIFLVAIASVVALGAFEFLRPLVPGDDGELSPLSMNLVIQMVMLVAGAIILLTCKADPKKIASTPVFKAGMTAVFSVFGVAWMADTFFEAHIDALESNLGSVVEAAPWAYAVVLVFVSKLVNSQAAALVAIAPIGLQLGIDPAIIVGFYGAAYGYFILPTYPSDLACIGFDRTGTTHIGKFVINHSFLVPGAISVFTSCVEGSLLAQVLL